MSRLEIPGPTKASSSLKSCTKIWNARIESSPPGLCPVDMTRAFIEMCQTQSCGKCTPCRVGLWQLKNLLTDVMNGTATMETLDLMTQSPESIRKELTVRSDMKQVTRYIRALMRLSRRL